MTLIQRLSLRSLQPLLAVVLAILGTITHWSALFGSGAALVLTVLGQVYLPGWLLARVLGKTRISHPIARWAWVLGSGLGLTITMGSIARFLGVPVPLYLLVLHVLMVVLALLPPSPSAPADHPWQPQKRSIPLYLLLAFCVIIVVWVSFQSRYRFWGFEDQPIFIGQAEWMASMPDAQPPGGLPILSRQISIATNQNGDTRLASDGWTYSHAAWVWVSGVPAAQVIWYDLTALFIWAGPLIAFAMAYELTGRESAGVWSAAALTIAGLFALDGLVYTPNYEAFGRLSVFQVNTLRFFTLTILLPLALTLGLGYLRAPRKRDLIVVALIGAALAFVHPFGITLFVTAMGTTALLTLIHSYLPHPEPSLAVDTSSPLVSRAAMLFLLVTLGSLLVIPFLQRLDRSGLGAADSIVKENQGEGAVLQNVPIGFLSIPSLGTYIRDPQAVFYHPIIALAAAFGLLAWLRWRRSLSARYMAAATTLMLFIAFLPGLTAFVNRLMATVGLYTTTFLLPVALIGGLLLEWIVERSIRWLHRYAMPLGVFLAIAWMTVTLTEPFPIPMSARDELIGFNTVQGVRQIQPYQMDLVDRLRTLLIPGQISVMTVPYSVSNILTEELSGVFITGGRASRNGAYTANARIYTALNPPAPWWDADDVDFIRRFGVTHLVLEADDTRLAQALTDSVRFSLLDTVDGYFIFAVHPDAAISESETRYQAMNVVYGQLVEPRWSKLGFTPERAGDVQWDALVSEWLAQPATLENQLGLAFSLLMAKRDAEALPIWENLHQEIPAVPLFAQATSQARYAVVSDRSALQPLLDELNGTVSISRVMAARSLYDAQLFYLLNEADIAQIVSVMTNDAFIWHQLAVLDRPAQVRRRAGLLMNRGQWASADAELNSLPPAELAPQDVMSLATLRFVQGDRAGGLEILQQASDLDWVAARAVLHRDRWVTNLAAVMLSSLVQKQTAPPLESLWVIADAGRLFAFSPRIDRDGDEHTLKVSAWFGGPKPFADPYPFNTWRFQIVNPSTGETYALNDVVATNPSDSLVQSSAILQLPADLPELSPAHVIIEPRYDDRIFAQPIIVPLVLNRPESSVIPDDATAIGVQFGDVISLDAFSLHLSESQLAIQLFWTANERPDGDYQVFVHIYDAQGNRIAQNDSAPVGGLYPTSQWRLDTVIDDTHEVTFDSPLTPGSYLIRVGMYRLVDGYRLGVIPAENAADNALHITTFTVP